MLKFGLSSAYPESRMFPEPGPLRDSYDVVIIGGGGHGHPCFPCPCFPLVVLFAFNVLFVVVVLLGKRGGAMVALLSSHDSGILPLQ